MPIDARWGQLEPADWDLFAQSWIAELRGLPRTSEKDYGLCVVMMNFTAKPEQQWQFILATVPYASDQELGHIAAGPVEHLLGNHGKRFIDIVERQAAVDPKFARMLSGVRKHLMTDEVWARVKVLQENIISCDDNLI